MDNGMDNFGNNDFNRSIGNVNPYASRYGTQNPQERGYASPIRPQSDPRMAPQNPMPSYQPQAPINRYAQPQMPPQQPQVPPQYVQQQGQISQQDFEDQFDYTRGMQTPIGMPMPNPQMNQMPIGQPMQMQPQQPKKRGLFSFMNKKQEQPQQMQPMYAQQFVNLQTPQTINDVKLIINMLKAGDTAFVDFSKANEAQSQRMLDFLSGASFALGGLMQPMGDKKFVLTPPGTGIRGQLDK